MKQLDSIKKTIQILDSIHYENYSEGKSSTFLDYMNGTRADEETLIEGVIFLRFAEQILDFKLGESLWRQSSGEVTRGKPDFIPVDNRTHPFVFDIKGTDTMDLSKHYKDKKKYLEDNELKYLILTNMRDLDVYTEERGIEIEDYNFNFVKLYTDYKENPKLVLDKENTQRFLNFMRRFRYQELTLEKKVERIAEAGPWTGIEELNPELLTERLRAIVKILCEDIKDRRSELAQFIDSDPNKAKNIAQEVELITSEMSRGREIKEATAESLQEILDAPETTLYGRALNSFFYRIAYFTMTRLLLARTWEDIGFIDQSLYDGGFKKWHENFNHEISRVLENAFGLAAKRYPWLFNVPNNYSWYEPSDDALIESLYELSNFNLTGLNQDILGSIYEEYIEKIDKKNKGQYYTPREIVSFIWDRVGYTKPKAFFWQFEGKRVPRFVFDPATGSGGFLVEAARRLREESGIDFDEFQDLFEIYRGILYYIFGAEISIFPYYITEVNLLIQLTPILKRMMELKPAFKERTPLGVVRVDALSCYNFKDVLFKEQNETILKDKTIDILPLDSPKKSVFDKIREKFDGKFSYCCANPPYVGEKGHKELFRETRRRFPYWEKFYQGKMDYLYWFIILGLSKLRDWGKLGFITTAYWPTADGASKLRKYILKNAMVKEMIFFEGVKIFEHAKGQHNMVFILQKLTDSAKTANGKFPQEIRNNNRIKIVQVKCENRDLPGKTIRENLAFLTKHISKYINKLEYEDKYIKVFWSGIRQRELPKDGGAWNFMYPKKPKEILQTIRKRGELLSNLCKVSVGTLTAADKVTRQNINWLTEEDIRKSNIKIDDGIFVLNENEYKFLNYRGKNIKPFFKNSDVAPYIIIPNESSFFIYATNTIKDDPVCMSHLSKFENLLKYSKKVRGEEHIPWCELVRKKSPELFEGPKIVTPNRSPQNTFGYSEESYYGVSDVFIIVTKKKTRESLKYILGLLNSALLNFWTSKKNKRKGNALEFVGTPLSHIPIHRIDFNNPEEVGLHDKIVEKVNTIRKRMIELANYSKYFKGVRLTKLKIDDPLPEVNDEVIIKELSSEKLYSLRTHPGIKIENPQGIKDTEFYLSKISKPTLILTGVTELKLKAKDGSVLGLTGSHELLKLVEKSLANWKGKSWAKIKEDFLIPESTDIYESQKSTILNKVKTLRTQIAQIQGEIDEVVNKLYRMTDEEIEIVKGNT